jgi:hypothetical protein
MEKVPLIKKDKKPSFRQDLHIAVSILMSYLRPNTNKDRVGIRFR